MALFQCSWLIAFQASRVTGAGATPEPGEPGARNRPAPFVMSTPGGPAVPGAEESPWCSAALAAASPLSVFEGDEGVHEAQRLHESAYC